MRLSLSVCDAITLPIIWVKDRVIKGLMGPELFIGYIALLRPYIAFLRPSPDNITSINSLPLGDRLALPTKHCCFCTLRRDDRERSFPIPPGPGLAVLWLRPAVHLDDKSHVSLIEGGSCPNVSSLQNNPPCPAQQNRADIGAMLMSLRVSYIILSLYAKCLLKMLSDMIKISRVCMRLLRIASLEDELDIDLNDPQHMIEAIRQNRGTRADVFTFIQRVPDLAPRYQYHMEWESMAVLEYHDYHHWFNELIDFRCRNKVRKAEKKGVEIRRADFDDDFVRGIMNIYNESPVRQGKRFWHYGKSFEEVKAANTTHLDRSDFIGAYYQGELIGFIKLVYGDRTARTEQIISKLEHRDKAPTNALISKAVELCDQKNVPYLIYGVWSTGSLGEFKQSSGFRKVDLPRYYVPMNVRGKIAIRLGLYKGTKERIPARIRDELTRIRRQWYQNRPSFGKRTSH
jgi:hypothetical protein